MNETRAKTLDERVAEREAELAVLRAQAAEDCSINRGRSMAFPDDSSRRKAVKELCQFWVKNTLVPMLKGWTPEGEDDGWLYAFNETGKYRRAFSRSDLKHQGQMLQTVATICGVNVNLFLFGEVEHEAAIRFQDLVVYHFRHYRTVGRPIENSLNGTVESVAQDYARNSYIVSALQKLETELLSQNCAVPHGLLSVKRRSKHDRERHVELAFNVKQCREEVDQLKGASSQAVFQSEYAKARVVKLTEQVAVLESNIAKTVEVLTRLDERIAKLEASTTKLTEQVAALEANIAIDVLGLNERIAMLGGSK